MVSVFKGQSCGKSDQIINLSKPSLRDAGAVGAFFEAYRAARDRASRVDLGRAGLPSHVFSAASVPSVTKLGRKMPLADIAAIDAVEGRARVDRPQRARS